MVDEQLKIDIPEQLTEYLKGKAKELANVSSLFFEYILLPRDNYIEITSDMKPKITDQMLSYVIQNILGIVVDTSVKYTANYNTIFKVPEINSEFEINDFFVANSSQKLRNTLSYLNPTNESIVTEKAMELVKEYYKNLNIYKTQNNLKFQRLPQKPSHWVNWRLNKNNEIRNEIHNVVYKLNHRKDFNLQTTLCKIKL